jgi:hypothetical protein
VWILLALAILAPIVWALAGMPPLEALEPWLDEYLPASLTTPQVASTSAVMVALILGLGLGVGRARAATTHLSTVAHEFGHGLIAALLGGRINRITMQRDGSGMAHYQFPRRRRVGQFLVSFAGYVAPAVFGLASLQAALAGLGAIWLAYIAATLGVMLLLAVRSWWGALLAVGLGAAAWGLMSAGVGAVPTLVVAGLGGVLLGGGLMDAVDQAASLGRSQRSDAWSMARQTGVTPKLFAGTQVAVVLAAAAVALILPIHPLW